MFDRRHSAHQCLGSVSAGECPAAHDLLLRWLALRKGSSEESGLTLIECLVAIIIITVVVAVITPPIFLAVGTRVNNRRTEQALQIAQAEIERVRLLMISSEQYGDIEAQLPAISAGIAPDALQSVPAPTTLCPAPPSVACAGSTALFPSTSELVSNAATLAPEFYVQTFRDRGAVVTRTVDNAQVQETIAFNMGVRVYSREAVDGNAPNANLLTEPASINFTSGTKARAFQPLVVLYTELTRGTEPNVLFEMNRYIRDNYTTN